MFKFNPFLLVYFVIGLSFDTFSQKTVTKNNQQWLQYYNQFELSDKAILFSDASIRRINYFQQWSQITARVGLGYALHQNIKAVTGFALFTFFNSDQLNRIEFRPYQEFNSTTNYTKVIVQQRIRTEFRFFNEIVDNTITPDKSFNVRFRYRLFCNIPIISVSKAYDYRILMLNVADEVFINAGNEIVYNMFDNNRLQFGLSLQALENLNFSFTYTFQFGQRNGAGLYEQSDILSLALLHKITRLEKSKLKVDEQFPTQ